ncbi:MAG: hypothetical protein KI790_01380 [Cyclobacteriaceae bacterium]|nr:hypothetical protein [Cyclobacteriaceae bacterium HetDA_MAG_MS6]
MISIYSTSMDELKAMWKKLEGDYELVEKIQLDPEKLEYRIKVTRPLRSEISPILKSVAEKIIELDELIHTKSFFEDFSYHNFLDRVEDEMNGAKVYPGIGRLTQIWKKLTQVEKKMLHAYIAEGVKDLPLANNSDELVKVE